MKKRLRVALLITRLDKGGSADAVLQLAAGLQEHGFCVLVISGKTINPTPLLIEDKNREYPHIQYVNTLIRSLNPIKDVLATFRIIGLLGKFRPHVLHTNSSKAGILGRIAGKYHKIPVVVHSPHGHIFYGYYNKWISRFFIIIEKFFARYTHKIVNLTNRGMKDHLAYRIAPRDKFIVNPVGIDLHSFRSVNIVPPESHFVISWVGRLDPIKDCGTFLKSLLFLKEKGLSFQALIAGDGSEKEELEKFAHDKGLNEVEFLGYMNTPVPVYRRSHLFVLSSLNEGFGRVLIEAMACGLPVVATHVGGVPELIRQDINGILVSPGNAREMSGAILKILMNKKFWCKISHENKKKAECYSLDNYINTTIRIYENALGE